MAEPFISGSGMIQILNALLECVSKAPGRIRWKDKKRAEALLEIARIAGRFHEHRQHCPACTLASAHLSPAPLTCEDGLLLITAFQVAQERANILITG